jgi:hypothetical protein
VPRVSTLLRPASLAGLQEVDVAPLSQVSCVPSPWSVRSQPRRLFVDLDEASAFFEAGSVGYSATRTPGRFDGLGLRTSAWRVEPTVVDHAHSSFFEDKAIFPAGTAELDNALLMRHVPVLGEPLADLHRKSEPVS